MNNSSVNFTPDASTVQTLTNYWAHGLSGNLFVLLKFSVQSFHTVLHYMDHRDRNRKWSCIRALHPQSLCLRLVTVSSVSSVYCQLLLLLHYYHCFLKPRIITVSTRPRLHWSSSVSASDLC